MTEVTRRDTLSMLAVLSGLGLSPAWAQAAAEEPVGMTLGEATPFDPAIVQEHAKALAAKAYVAPPTVPQGWLDLTYDQYREIWFDTRHSLWRGTGGAAQVEFFPTGLYFPNPIAINAVEAGQTRPVKFELRVFDTTDRFPKLPEEGSGFSGLRLLGELEQPELFQEYLVFRGASYFRAIARGQAYGISARGLALNTASDRGEEFPLFREFWIEAADVGAPTIRIHALMDSPSLAGAFVFEVSRGNPTVMQVEARIYPRVDLDMVGVAPGTSMFLFNQVNRGRFDDFRDAVHDSDGLLMVNGASEVLWRPLTNPLALGISAFADTSPKGFGLMQRARAVGAFEDLAAHYEKRPSLWVEPIGDWGPGHVMLVEIPTDKEINDNIVAFWRPDAPLTAGQEHVFAYKLFWCDTAPAEGTVARVIDTRTGKRVFESGRIFTIDFENHPALGDDPTRLQVVASSSVGSVTSAYVQVNPATQGMRLDFTVDAPDAPFFELRAELRRDDIRVSEIWLSRWIET